MTLFDKLTYGPQHMSSIPHINVGWERGSLGYPDPQKIRRRVWAIGFGENVHSGMLLTHNCLPANASLVDFSITYQDVPPSLPPTLPSLPPFPPSLPTTTEAFNATAGKGKQMMIGGTKSKTALQTGYFGKTFDRVMEVCF